MRTLYFDCHSGISGDMALSALVDLGADPNYIQAQLAALPLAPFTMSFLQVNRQGITAKWLQLGFEDHGHGHSRFKVLSAHHSHRTARQIFEIIDESDLPVRVKERSTAIFGAIAEAEGKIHGVDPQDVHFHEVGAMDSIIDVIGVCLALEDLGADKLIFSPIPTGSGQITIAHGLYPVPAPATAELLRGIPLSPLTAEGELTTPTGAGIAKVLASGFGPLPAGTLERIGYGAGTKDFAHPNVLRAFLIHQASSIGTLQEVHVIEAHIDDMTGEMLGYAMERLFSAGALDVYYTSVMMKKNRPGILITVICLPAESESCEHVLLTETSTFGLRRSVKERRILPRRFIEVDTAYGVVRVKQSFDGERIIHQTPEYEDAAQVSRASGVPLEQVYRDIIKQLE
ncbi:MULTISPECIES: nickel pincer cofactor biosynthesis protein LarC [unclassified Paenibacillus]|uniref:nickel pincer cofactor biosynthesis protein LarC n=1 Tax=unclassified Paenibacillus TaxID=185978 RepID=UPI0024067848|nr:MULTISPECIES: nickel pincer cofactor biosynthesis protein LarC [unclassified Paenibacillus]MDF9844149.1 uncharacterized protein (TIGR00299 family) protein [Paenibacillus sp. PastF-2]MDF9850728.1 uncharacterized protein (TIGR00299 family) protein [Paenibacillus sp. PastM-2]MDF9857299.1 uncharacterized protein (TIGR00299 family) protein [Paenibacillus sp. PastF-1]MDH6482593.1 uncharacterized protein (TIGR00299 family) protein [Paenibacillus sp. PastH-2]MDH6510020.1 uncharacterized protein (TI